MADSLIGVATYLALLSIGKDDPLSVLYKKTSDSFEKIRVSGGGGGGGGRKGGREGRNEKEGERGREREGERAKEEEGRERGKE